MQTDMSIAILFHTISEGEVSEARLLGHYKETAQHSIFSKLPNFGILTPLHGESLAHNGYTMVLTMVTILGLLASHSINYQNLRGQFINGFWGYKG